MSLYFFRIILFFFILKFKKKLSFSCNFYICLQRSKKMTGLKFYITIYFIINVNNATQGILQFLNRVACKYVIRIVSKKLNLFE